MTTLVPDRRPVLVSDIIKGKNVDDFEDYRNELLARFTPEQPPTPQTPADVLSHAREMCSRSMALVHQQSTSKRPPQKPSLIRAQYGGDSGDRDHDREAEINEEAHFINNRTVYQLFLTRSLTRTWTSDATPTISVDVNVSQDESSLSPTNNCSKNHLRLSPHQLCSRNPGFHASAVDAIAGASDPTASHTVSPSAASPAAAAGTQLVTEPYSSTSDRSLNTRQLNVVTGYQGPRGMLPSLSCRDGTSNGHSAVIVTDRLVVATGLSYRHSSSTARAKDEECRASDEDGDEDEDKYNDVICDNGLTPSNYLTKPPGLDRALSYLRPQPPSAPRLERKNYQSLEHFSSSNLVRSETILPARFTADNEDTRSGAAAAPPIFPSTGGNTTKVSGDEEGEDFLGEWLLSTRGRPGAPPPHSPGSALKPTLPNPTRPSVAPGIPSRGRWVATAQAMYANPASSGGLQPPLRPTSPPEPTGQMGKILPQSSSAAAVGATETAAPTPPAQAPSASSSSSAPMTLLSHLLMTADRTPWKFTRADNSQPLPPDDAVDLVVRPRKSVRDPPLELSSFSHIIDGGTGGSEGYGADIDSGGGGGGGGGGGSHACVRAGVERSCQSFRPAPPMGLAAMRNGSAGDLTAPSHARTGSMGSGGIGGPNSRCVTVHSSSAASSPTGYQAQTGPCSFSSLSFSPKTQPQSPSGGHAHARGTMRFRQHQHQQTLRSPGATTEAAKDHLFRPLCLDDLPGSPAAIAPTSVAQIVLVSSGGSPLSPDTAALSPGPDKAPHVAIPSDDPLLAAAIVTASGGNSSIGAAVTSHGPRNVGRGPASGAHMISYPHQQHQNQSQLPSPSDKWQRRMGALQRKASDGDMTPLRTKVSFGGSMADGCPGGREQPSERIAGGRRASLAVVDGGCAHGDGSESLMARLFKTLNDLRRMESDARDVD
ncbi:hypothetical protein VaNZ11_009327 [Volvox africanus]|uniref:Uncharacterized protein n=1 Tax=Volvox africanus TaxID=51714 RepID=A0ABQ5S7U6_9CHLO|nr:hypothetical protein VaNZ11_009327 [Volvox africanus]